MNKFNKIINCKFSKENTPYTKKFNYSKNNKNLIVTPHIAGLTFDSEKKAANICIKNLSNFFKANDNKKK